ncbi:putative phosphonate transport system ATP-binding protein [Sphingobium sp. OAS761]|uniref:phosphonate C-P lyase system protein PhnK n=1 Tax=Sphingobium sp. OAS761 TaxID=2817901 RepID=UPI00209F5288|nr:phosphonate C-P lyase system protein PhnK [Sphingobium sp. OAS761]MCP1470448.1 putative phosphonate transport system ATP-binding protein [Sphingobium sp. OAS761]
MTALLSGRGLTRMFDGKNGCAQIDIDLHPGEVTCIVGESGSGKTTLLNLLSLQLRPDAGSLYYRTDDGARIDLGLASEIDRRRLMRTEWGFVRQNPRDGLLRDVSAGANISERLMANGARHYGALRDTAIDWMRKVELDHGRVDDLPRDFSGGMQQRLQIARNLVTGPRLLFMDEPTAGLDVSVQARLLDLLRTLTSQLGIAILIVTHDIGVARLLAHRLLVMRRGRIIETGLTDQVLDDPQQPYTQMLVSSVLPV